MRVYYEPLINSQACLWLACTVLLTSSVLAITFYLQYGSIMPNPETTRVSSPLGLSRYQVQVSNGIGSGTLKWPADPY